MQPGCPYLLEVMGDQSLLGGAPPPASPGEEEGFLRGLPTAAWPGWEALSRMLERAWGLSLLLEEGIPLARGWLGAGGQRTRYIRVQARGGQWIVLEHPGGLELLDREAQPGAETCLALPSRFNLWWSQAAEAGSGRLKPSVSPADPASDAAVFQHFLDHALKQDHPSDWHLEPEPAYYRSRFRVHGRLEPAVRLSRDKGDWLIQSFLRACAVKERQPGEAVEGSLPFTRPGRETVSIRVSLVPTLYGDSLAARFAYPAANGVPEAHQLGLTGEQGARLEAAFREGEGLWMVCGPTGSGKSTTLHALVGWAVRAGEKVLAVEDPVETPLPGVQQVSLGDPPGMSFAVALKAFLRQAPDSLLVGEIRDTETAAITLQAARSGHRVLTSLHAGDEQAALRRFCDFGFPECQIRSVSRMILLQRLLPLLCPVCRILAPLPAEWPTRLQAASLSLPELVAFPNGCARCRGGYRGRTGIFACLPGRQTGEPAETLLQAAWRMVCQGQTGLDSLGPFLPADPFCAGTGRER